jgi:hypothetical protein
MKKTICVMAFLFLTLAVQAALVDDFESYTPGATSSPWVITQGTPVIGQETGGNQYLESYGSYLPLGSNSIPAADTSTTAFFRLYKTAGSSPDCSVGLSHLAVPAGDWTNFEAYVSVVEGALLARNNTVNTIVVAAMTEATWYNIWLVLNNSANTYDVYVTTGSAGAAISDRKAAGFGFRNDLGELVTFKVYGRSANGPIWIDDISITPGIDLTIPTDGPAPAVVVANPGNAAVNETQTAAFTTVFTSETAPTAAWYKVSSPDIAMDPADVQTSYNTQTQQYTSTLSITGVTISDNGQYYCRIDNASGYTRNSAAATLTVYGLIAHWTLDQSDFVSGQYVDSVGGHHAVVAGTPVFVAGADGLANKAVQISPTAGWAAVDGFTPSTSGQLSVSLWVNWQQTPPGTADDLAITAAQTGGTSSVTATNGLTAGTQWQHFCMVFDGTNGRLYIDGVLQAQGAISLPMDMTSLLSIGSTDSGTESFNGYMDDLRVYNYAMTDTDVLAVHDAMTGGCTLQFDLSGPAGQPDCIVNVYDLMAFANAWLNPYDYADFSGLSSEWLSGGL